LYGGNGIVDDASAIMTLSCLWTCRFYSNVEDFSLQSNKAHVGQCWRL